MSIGSTISMRVCAPHILATATSQSSRLCSYYLRVVTIQGQRLIVIYVLSIQPCSYLTQNLEKMSIFITLTGSHHQDLQKARLMSLTLCLHLSFEVLDNLAWLYRFTHVVC